MADHLIHGSKGEYMGFLSGISDFLFKGEGEDGVENKNKESVKVSEQLKEKDLAAEAESMGFKELSVRISANLKEINNQISNGYFILADKEYIQGVIQKLLSELSVSDPDKKITPEELERINKDYKLLFEKISIPPVPETSKNIKPDSSKEETEKIFANSIELYIYVLKVLGLDEKNIDDFINQQREQVENQLNL